MTLVLCTRSGELLGALPPYDVALPWWQEVGDVVAGAWERYGVQVTVLRLLGVGTAESGSGGPVAYLAETLDPVPVEIRPWPGADPLADHPLRLPHARPGGPATDLAWADEVLAGRGAARTGPAVQQRTWNLSSLWRLPSTAGEAWLKVVPPFFAHEGQMLLRLDAEHPGVVPVLLGTDGPRMLLSHVPGGDNYHAGLPVLLGLVRTLVELQAEWSGRLDELLSLGAPDWRADALTTLADDAVSRSADRLEPATLTALRLLVERLDRRFAAVGECGVPDTLVHGDYHPGNTVGSTSRPVLLDWGDCGAGHALLDQAAFTARLTGAERAAVSAEWSRRWRAARPGCHPDRAAQLVRPVAALRQAVVYWSFLDQIEPSERVYHEGDPADWLRRAAALTTDAT